MSLLYSQLLGGIGNILFIVANIYSLSIDRKMNYCVSNNTSSVTKRKDESKWLNTILKSVNKVNKKPNNIKFRYREKNHFYKKIPDTKNHSLELSGYFQSEKYFIHNKTKIIKLFTKHKNKIQNKLNNIFNYNDNTISLHIRRGDYLKLQHAHIVQSIDYFKNALQMLSEKLNYGNINELNKDYKFMIFSDDIKWCENNDFFNSFHNKRYMGKNSAIEDLYLLSMCNHNIICNSTFSWWGAYLNNNKNNIVIAPSKWFNENYMKPNEWNDIYCKDWIVI